MSVPPAPSTPAPSTPARRLVRAFAIALVVSAAVSLGVVGAGAEPHLPTARAAVLVAISADVELSSSTGVAGGDPITATITVTHDYPETDPITIDIAVSVNPSIDPQLSDDCIADPVDFGVAICRLENAASPTTFTAEIPMPDQLDEETEYTVTADPENAYDPVADDFLAFAPTSDQESFTVRPGRATLQAAEGLTVEPRVVAPGRPVVVTLADVEPGTEVAVRFSGGPAGVLRTTDASPTTARWVTVIPRWSPPGRRDLLIGEPDARVAQLLLADALLVVPRSAAAPGFFGRGG